MTDIRTYSARCRNCKYSRSFGAARITAETKATVHALKKGHIIDLTTTHLATLLSTTETIPSNNSAQEEIWS